MASISTELILILLLLVANGLFAAAEVSVVASRKARLQQRASGGDAGAEAALALVEAPTRFLATVQIGITLIGIFAGAFGGATLSRPLAAALDDVPALAPYAESLALGIVVLAITYLSLVVGELVPKRIALHSPERLASAVARPMSLLSFIAAPFVSFLGLSTDVALRLIGLRPSEEPPVSEEEINVMMEQGRQAGVFADAEQEIVQRVFRLGDRTVRSLMTPRPDIVWLDLEAPWEENRRRLTENVYSRLPLCRGTLDEVVGVLRAKDLLDAFLDERPPELTGALMAPVFVPETMSAFRLMESFKAQRTHLILVIDEHGSVQGLVTLHDILGAMVGELPYVDESDEPYAVQRDDGSWLIDGLLPVEEFRELFTLDRLPGEEEGNFHTMSGFVMSHMGRIPEATESFDLFGLRVEVLDMDGRLVDKLLVRPLGEEGDAPCE